MNPIGAFILVAVVAGVFLLPRRWALLSFAAGILYLTQGQSLNVAGFNLHSVRFIELAAFLRVVRRGEVSFSQLHRIDRTFLLLYVYTTVVFLLRSEENHAYQIGGAVDAFLCYFSFRGLIKELDDLTWFLRAFLLLLVPYTALIMFESFTYRNPFSFMGGIDYSGWERAGRLRSQGSFRHPSLLGTLGATFVPLYLGLWFGHTHRARATVGLGCCLLIIWASNSGGPVNCLLFGLIGWCLWPFRASMRAVRWGLVGGIALLALVMKAPIWYLPAKVSAFTGGGGYHRSHLMEMAERNFGQWWVAGMPIAETASWFPYTLTVTGGADMTNQFLSFGIAAGAMAMILLFALLTRAFQSLGQALGALRAQAPALRESELLVWGLGCMLIAHMANWLGITYFDQTYALWFLHLAAIVSISSHCLQRAAASHLQSYPPFGDTANIDHAAQTSPPTPDEPFATGKNQ